MTKDASQVQRILFFALRVDIKKLFSEPAFIWVASSDLVHFSQPTSLVEASYTLLLVLFKYGLRSVAVTNMYKQLQMDFHTILYAFLARVGKLTCH